MREREKSERDNYRLSKIHFTEQNLKNLKNNLQKTVLLGKS